MMRTQIPHLDDGVPTSGLDAFGASASEEQRDGDEGADNVTNRNDAFEDEWGGDGEEAVSSSWEEGDAKKGLGRRVNTPSDLPRLRQEHVTAGYRDGVVLAKASTAQAGFDEGFKLGATMGALAGRMMGILDGICAAVSGPGQEAESERMKGLVAAARRELDARAIFDGKFWDRDGVWTFEIRAGTGGEDEVSFRDVIATHPLIRKWEGIVDKEVESWGVDLEVMNRRPRGGEREDGGSEKTQKKGPVAAGAGAGVLEQLQELAW